MDKNNKKMYLKKGMVWFALLCTGLPVCFAEQPQQPTDYKTFLEQVWKQNLTYAAEKLNIDVAEAGVKAAKIFNDPVLSVEYADNDERRLQMGRSVSVELSKTFSFGKRNARIDLARSEKELNDLLLEDYFHCLRAEATLTYLEALKQAELYALRENSYGNILRLAEADSVRFTLGQITGVDATQSRLEAEKAANDLLQARMEMLNAYAALSLWTGKAEANVLYAPAGKLRPQERLFDMNRIVQTALEHRADLAAALKNVDVARKELKVVQRERNTDVDVALGYNYNTKARNEIAPAPQFNGVTLGVVIPLKFSNTNKGAVRAADLRRQQAELNYRQAELEVRNSVMQSLRQYASLLEQVRHFETGMLDKARAILDDKIYSYEHGETSRLEVLIAQQTGDELRAAYIETIFNSLTALVELERNAGIWDIVLE